MATKNEGMGKFGDAAGGALKGAAKGAQYGSLLGPIGTAAGAAIGGIAGGIKGGKLSPAEQAAKAAREQRERLQRDPNKVAGMSDATQQKNIMAMMRAGAGQYQEGDSQAMQQAIQQAGVAAVGTQAQLAAQAAQAQQQQVLKLADYEAKMLAADEAQRKGPTGKDRLYEQQADDTMVARARASMDEVKDSKFAQNAAAGARDIMGKIGGLFGGAV